MIFIFFVNSHAPFDGLIDLDLVMLGLKFQMPQASQW
jgi:hypothetical protein